MERMGLLALAAAAALGSAGLAQAATVTGIGIQFYTTGGSNDTPLATTDVAGVPAVAQSNWNTLAGSSFTNVSVTDNAGTGTAVLNGSGDGNYFAENGFSSGSGDAKLASAGLQSAWGNSYTLTISSVPYASYDVYVYAENDAASRQATMSVTANGVTQYQSFLTESAGSSWNQAASTWNGQGTAPGDLAAANYGYFPGVNASSFTFTYYAPGNAGVNGIQIVQAVPEPATAGLLGLGAATLLMRRRHRA